MLYDYEGKRYTQIPICLASRTREGLVLPGALRDAIRARLNDAIDGQNSFKALWLAEYLTRDEQEQLIAAGLGKPGGAWAALGELVAEVIADRADEWHYFEPPDEKGQPAAVYYFRRSGVQRQAADSFNGRPASTTTVDPTANSE